MEQDSAVDFLDHVVKNLVDNPDSVKVSKTVDEMGVLLTLETHADDMGKIIGRKGATAKAIRTLLRVVGMKNNARVNMKILEPEGGMRAQETAGGEEEAPAPVSATADVDMDAAMDDIKADL